MTASPLLPRGVAGHMTETEATDAEQPRHSGLLHSRPGDLQPKGGGRPPVPLDARAR